MIRYLLDTNVVVSLLKEPAGLVAHRLRSHEPAEVGLSVVATHEIYYGAFRSQRREHNLGIADALLFEVVPLDREDAREAGEIRAELARRGLPIGPYDVLIAGQARARALTLVTANGREFSRVEGLSVEDWSGKAR
jgi:tRNA(fMet)-specific endonuclease VapC